MKANPSPMSVADYCQDLNDKKTIVNTQYQRSGGIWSSQAKSFFIESILLQYPIPKIFLYAKIDLKTRKTIKEIVDGQQRSNALRDFFNNKLRLSIKVETEELRGKKYSQLDDEWQTSFLSYSLPIDQFSGIPEDEVQEAFRRMNSSNVPLNDEEQRNAKFQGLFKWFIIDIAKDYRSYLTSIGLFSKRDVIRMVDLKVYSEVIHAIDGGFHTVKAPQINSLYRKYNSKFDDEDAYREKIVYGVEAFIERPELHQKLFLRAHVFQSIVLALIALRYKEEFFIKHAKEVWKDDLIDDIDLNLLLMSLQDPEDYPDLLPFINACSKQTNVATSKAIRFLHFFKVLAND